MWRREGGREGSKRHNKKIMQRCADRQIDTRIQRKKGTKRQPETIKREAETTRTHK